jgi:hypothetical protein
MHAAHKFTSLQFLWLSKFAFFKVYSYLSIVHICIFFLWNLQANLFKRCIPIIITMIFNQQIRFSTFEFHWPIAVQQNIIRHQINGLGKDHSGEETPPSILSSGPLRRIHFHLAKYGSLLIQCILYYIKYIYIYIYIYLYIYIIYIIFIFL